MIPYWLQGQITEVCTYCGSPIVNNANLTDRHCSNNQCPGHMAQKMSRLATRLGVANFGPARSLEYIRYMKPFCHTQIIQEWFPNQSLELHLWEVCELAMIKGYSKRWREICHGCTDMGQVVATPAGNLLSPYDKAVLLVTAGIIKILPPMLGEKIYVMLTGSFEGFKSRNDYITGMNSIFGDYVQLIDVGKRKTGVDFLVKEPWTTDHEKSAIAAEMGIPVISPTELMQRIQVHVAYITEKGVGS